MPDPKLGKWKPQSEIDAEKAAAAAERQRVNDLREDARRQEIMAQLATATPQQISDYVDSNVNNMQQAREMLKRIILVLSTMARE